ncbi:MAG: DsbA family protein [Microthrixaceae bacterium]
MNESSIIEVFADVACPFTHVGLRRFVERRAEVGRTDVRLKARAWPLEFVNGVPMDAAFIAEEVATIRNHVAPDLFIGFEEASFPSTSLPAFALAAAAYRMRDAVGEAVSLELRTLLFEDGLDIASDAVIGELADKHGVTITDEDRSAAAKDHAEGVERKVIGSPHFFTPGGAFFCPTLDVSRDANGELHVQMDSGGFNEFIDSCFGI